MGAYIVYCSLVIRTDCGNSHSSSMKSSGGYLSNRPSMLRTLDLPEGYVTVNLTIDINHRLLAF